MNKLLRVLIVLVICVVALGFYRGWFAMSTQKSDAEGHKVDINFTVDADKVEADTETVKKKAAELTSRVTEGATEGVEDDGEQPIKEEKSEH